ncbi:DUF4831 family protein [Ancylomarina euxinus]|uniref:DUF4831 family protein n=1 Tax=Ancylomarina euxinus TaxID=2283627 RepID=A0A425Y5M8_9BACT|nr:DUF4831 family protein [Ancylomarina euxinus]MCZ4694267.1 DUF4831 family protein [Ancylomarina euxinus]MUP14401.1 DUF4831 family protein [Ancylomarina euxinus]RRG23710.1 DUF4831 family protein [Ancylomarina euxinus]
MFRLFVKIMLVAVCCFQFISAEAQKRKADLDVPSTVVYALPQTVLDVDVFVEKKILKVGPFASFSEKYIGVTPKINSDAVKWNVKSVSVSEKGEVDPQNFYKLTSVGNYQPNLIQLTPDGLIKGFNMTSSDTEKEMVYASVKQEIDVEIEYGKFSIDPNLLIKKDTVYKVVETDTAFIKVPELKEEAFAKSIEDKAKEAAHQLFKLRKRRFKILTANYEVLPPDGKAYEIIIKELDKLEKEYLALFLGKEVSVIERGHFVYKPSAADKGGVIFRISPEKGLVDVSDLKAVPVRVEFKNLGVTSELPILPQDPDVLANTLIHYRIPGQAEVMISKGKDILYEEKHIIAQFGKVMTLPSQVLVHEGYSIEFYPESGAIKRISMQK